MKFEIWKDIKGYEGLYQVSNLGEIKSLCRKKGFLIGKEKILKPTKNNKGYLYVTLRKSMQSKKMLVHQIVALTFINNPNKCKILNHKDGNPSNNCVDNLEWCTQKYNVNHCYKILGYKGSNYKKYGKNSNNHKSINQYNKERDFIRTWDCIKDASEELNISCSSISNCLNKKSKTAGGFIWKYHL